MASGIYFLYNTLAGARCRNVTSVVLWVVYKILPLLLVIANENLIFAGIGAFFQGMFPIYVLWLGRRIFALLYDETEHKMLVGHGRNILYITSVNFVGRYPIPPQSTGLYFDEVLYFCT